MYVMINSITIIRGLCKLYPPTTMVRVNLSLYITFRTLMIRKGAANIFIVYRISKLK